jgi:hypothetical protein
VRIPGNPANRILTHLAIALAGAQIAATHLFIEQIPAVLQRVIYPARLDVFNAYR